MDSQDHSGYVQNVKDINSSSFSFDLQAKESSMRFVCFSPEKRKEIDEKITSPVKVKRARLTGKNLVYQPNSEMEDVELDFKPINFDDITIGTLHMVASGSLIDIDIQVIKKVEDKVVKEKKLESFVVGDATGSCKFTVWEDSAGVLVIGSSYKLTNARVTKDIYGSFGLQTPQKGFSIEKRDKQIKAIETTSVASAQVTSKIGEIMFVESLTRYKTCVNQKCRKKLPQTTQKSVVCNNCNGLNKIRFCDTGMFAKFIFSGADNQKTNLTMFQDSIKKLVPEADKLTDEDLKRKLMEDFEQIKVTIGKKGDTVNDVELLPDE